jgi:hypothetical protein
MGLGGADDPAGTTWPRDVNMREVINGGLLYLLWTGCQWQALPKEPVRRFFFVIESSGLLARQRPDGADDRPEQKHPAEKVDVLASVLRHICPWFTAHGSVHRGDAN